MPLDRQTFAGGMATLGVAFNREVEKPQLRVFYQALQDLTAEQFERGVQAAISRETFFPTVAVIRKYALPAVDAHATAVRLFEKIKGMARYSPFIGSYWSEQEVKTVLGPAAADAFMAAGGSSALEGLDDRSEPFVRKAFVEAVQRAVDADPAALAPPEKQRALPAAVKALTAGIGNGPRKAS